MRYYAHFGHTEFILCLGYGAASVKDYFLQLPTRRSSNDFVLSKGGQNVELLDSPTSATGGSRFIDTGIDTAIGERLRRVRPYLEDDEIFLANYGDVLTDAPMNRIIDDFIASDAVGEPARGAAAGLLPRRRRRRGRPGHRTSRRSPTCRCGSTAATSSCGRAIFDFLDEGEDLVDGRASPGRPSRAGSRRSRYNGFWAPMDTLKERSQPRGPAPQRQGPVEALGAQPDESAVRFRDRRAAADRAPVGA